MIEKAGATKNIEKNLAGVLSRPEGDRCCLCHSVASALIAVAVSRRTAIASRRAVVHCCAVSHRAASRCDCQTIQHIMSKHQRTGSTLDMFGGFKRVKRSAAYERPMKKLAIWKLKEVRGLFMVLNREDSSDGSLGIKDYFKTSDKYGGKRLLKSPYWGQSFRWDYDGQHETTEAWKQAMSSTKLFKNGERVLCKIVDLGEVAMDFMYLDSEIVVLVREHPDVFADHDHAAYFTNEGHATLENTCRAADAEDQPLMSAD